MQVASCRLGLVGGIGILSAGLRAGYREDVHGGGVGAYGCGVDPGFGLLDGVVVDEVAGLEVVGGVEDDLGVGEEGVDVGGDEVFDVGVDADVGVEEGDLTAGGFCLGERVEGVLLVEEDLTLEIGGFDEVAVDEREGADPGAGEERGCRGSGGSAAYDGGVSGGEALLACGANAGEENLAGVTLAVVDRCRCGCGRGFVFLYRMRHGGGFLRPKTLLFRSIGNGSGWRELTGIGRTFRILTAGCLKPCNCGVCDFGEMHA